MIEERQDPYAHFTRDLEQIAGKNVLEVLKIHISVSTNCTCTTDPAVWSRLDEVLSRPNGFPFLWLVEFSVALLYYSFDYTDLQAELEDIGKNCFPWLWENEDIDFSFEVFIEDV
ncbi:hypothetical protein CPB84DRAFT_565177 [Gymnopilus junonius]|uniref:Uncharacterized protein n=1 Tax=Gymnopilus junonius TaxID=109634 RepID=A0A9P5NVB0_GYMJU|nr:hypothetical protein CPB84DRAFT_565177 [Gymnopilus junonius]